MEEGRLQGPGREGPAPIPDCRREGGRAGGKPAHPHPSQQMAGSLAPA